MVNVQSRRDFFRVAPVAAAALLPVASCSLKAWGEAGGQMDAPAAGARYEVFPKQSVDTLVAGLEAAPAAREIVPGKGTGLSVTVSAEAGKIAKEFEMHEHRDHLFQVLDGSTMYEIGGTLRAGRQTKPGEWLAAECEGFSKVTLGKGDLLSIPRGTPHRRITQGAVSLLLVNTIQWGESRYLLEAGRGASRRVTAKDRAFASLRMTAWSRQRRELQAMRRR